MSAAWLKVHHLMNLISSNLTPPNSQLRKSMVGSIIVKNVDVRDNLVQSRMSRITVCVKMAPSFLFNITFLFPDLVSRDTNMSFSPFSANRISTVLRSVFARRPRFPVCTSSRRFKFVPRRWKYTNAKCPGLYRPINGKIRNGYGCLVTAK